VRGSFRATMEISGAEAEGGATAVHAAERIRPDVNPLHPAIARHALREGIATLGPADLPQL
jgi:hypothetical protein